jgi:hypothetical protein
MDRLGSLRVLGARFLAQSRRKFLNAECGGNYRDLSGQNHVVAQTQVGERETTSKVPHFGRRLLLARLALLPEYGGIRFCSY